MGWSSWTRGVLVIWSAAATRCSVPKSSSQQVINQAWNVMDGQGTNMLSMACLRMYVRACHRNAFSGSARCIEQFIPTHVAEPNAT